MMKPTKKSTVTVFVDESGTLPDPNDRVIVLAAIGMDSMGQAEGVFKKARKFVKSTKKNSEIKFYNAGERSKKLFLKEVVLHNIQFFVLIVEKHGQKISDSPENFALLSWVLLEDCLLFYPKTDLNIIFDRHFHRKTDQQQFDKILKDQMDKVIHITHRDSREYQIINIADFVAGSVLWAKTGRDNSFYKIIKNKIVSEKTLNWKELRKGFFEIKNLDEPM